MTFGIPWLVITQPDTAEAYVSFPSFCWEYALMCLLPAVMTLSLHCAELLANVVRGEKTWPHAGSCSWGLNSVSGLS